MAGAISFQIVWNSFGGTSLGHCARERSWPYLTCAQINQILKIAPRMAEHRLEGKLNRIDLQYVDSVKESLV